MPLQRNKQHALLRRRDLLRPPSSLLLTIVLHIHWYKYLSSHLSNEQLKTIGKLMLLLGRFSRTLISASSLLAACSTTTKTTTTAAWTTSSSFLAQSRTAAYLFSGSTALFSSSSASASDMTSTSSSCSLLVAQVPCLSDNYGYLIHDPATGETAAVDTPEAGPYKRELEKRGWKLTAILNTHHHWDHTGANEELKALGGVTIFGPASEKIPGIDVKLQGGDEFEFGSTKAKVIDVGGHTKGHIAYHFADDAKVFVGDSLFALVGHEIFLYFCSHCLNLYLIIVTLHFWTLQLLFGTGMRENV